MSKTWVSLCAALAVALVGCSESAPDTGTARFAVSVRQAVATDVARVTVTSSGPDIPSVTVDLAPTNGVWGGTIGNIPAGTDRAFFAQAFNASGALIFEGSATGVTLLANQTALVAITLQEVNPPPPYENEAPVIDSFVVSSTSVEPGGTLFLVAAAHDPNPEDTISYGWGATAGDLTASGASATWTAPTSEGLQTLTLTVTDSRELSSSVSVVVNVTRGGGEGEAELSLVFNSAPFFGSVTATESRLAVGQTTTVSVLAADPDVDPLSYSWSATCEGTWTDATSSTATFTPTSLPPEDCNNCRLTVVVSDGRGGHNTGTIAVCVTDSPPTHRFPPVILRSYRSSDTASPGDVLTYEVVASDPQGSALTFSWEATAGTLGTPTGNGARSRITWTAPPWTCDPSITVRVTITNALGLTATRSFTVTGLPPCPSPGFWTRTGPVTEIRSGGHTVTRLPDGRVLVAGGGIMEDVFFSSAELYDPASNSWSPTDSMTDLRSAHTATLLPDGRVLVTGGGNNMVFALESTELYDPASGTWSPAASMAEPRYFHTATLLPDGRVLVTGGVGPLVDPASAELYDPASNTWSPAGSMSVSRFGHTATLLPDGRVLLVGGLDDDRNPVATAEVFDPATGTFTPTEALVSAHYYHAATRLPDGRVLVTGGSDGSYRVTRVAEVYDPATNSWSATDSMGEARTAHTATLLPDGRVLVAGGYDGTSDLATAELYDPATGAWSSTASMHSPRASHEATLLLTGRVLVVGGVESTSEEGAEVYTP